MIETKEDKGANAFRILKSQAVTFQECFPKYSINLDEKHHQLMLDGLIFRGRFRLF